MLCVTPDLLCCVCFSSCMCASMPLKTNCLPACGGMTGVCAACWPRNDGGGGSSAALRSLCQRQRGHRSAGDGPAGPRPSAVARLCCSGPFLPHVGTYYLHWRMDCAGQGVAGSMPLEAIPCHPTVYQQRGAGAMHAGIRVGACCALPVWQS